VQDEALLIVCPDCSGEGYRPVKALSSDALSLLRALYEWEGRGLAQVVAAMQVVEGLDSKSKASKITSTGIVRLKFSDPEADT
jgi:hypothetical protein